jgi:PhnB protein
MSNGKKGIPENSSVVMPRLYCRDVAAEVDFCKTVFDAVQLNLRPGPDGKAAHALMTIGPAMIMIEAEWPGFASRAPALDGSSPVVIFVYVEDVDRSPQNWSWSGMVTVQPAATARSNQASQSFTRR